MASSASGSDEARISRFLTNHGLQSYDQLLVRADADPEWFWNAVTAFFDPVFVEKGSTTFDERTPSEHRKWLPESSLNIVDTCLRIDEPRFEASAPAIIWEAEDGTKVAWNREELADQVRRAADGLQRRGISKGARVGILMPMIPETVAAFLAIASVGALALPLFSGYGAEAVAQRLRDADAKGLITADGTHRRGRLIDIKQVADAALASVPTIDTVVVVERAGNNISLDAERDLTWSELVKNANFSEPIPLDAESHLMIAYTSGTSGQPKGTIHSHGGFLLKVLCDLGLLLDIQSRDQVMWMGDFGWLTGPILVTGVLSVGGTLVMCEGTPDFPEEDRVFSLLSRHHINVFSLSPTLIRALMAKGTTPASDTDLTALRIIASTGEAWSQAAWAWCKQHLGRNGAKILNYTGGTEIGGSILSGNLLLPEVPCSVGKPAPAMGATIMNEDGRPSSIGEVGELVLRHPSPGLSRGLWNAEEVYLKTYWDRHPGMWSHSDLVLQDDDGQWFMRGRRDEVIKVAGKRIGAMEIENVVLRVPGVYEAAVVASPDSIKGEALAVFCVTSDAAEALKDNISSAVTDAFGSAFRPELIVLVPDLPRTRTNKVMRNVLRQLASKEKVAVSHVANPEVIEIIEGRLTAH